MVLAALVLLQAAAGPLAPATRPAAFDAATFDPIIQSGIRAGAYPGAALVVGRADTVLFIKGYGRLTWSPRSSAVAPDSTLFDLASLTKVVATTTALMLLVERGAVKIDTPVRTYVPEFNGDGTAGITVRQLLTHTSGLRATLPLYEEPDAAAALQRVFAATPIYRPGTRVVYSDLNAILLGEIVRRAAGEPLDRFAAREIFAPLGLTQTLFRPPAALRRRIAPTGEWHGHAVAGEVNDRNAARLGGVAGHAGLFATGAGAGLAGGAHRRGREQCRHLVRAAQLRTYRLDGHVALDRSGPGRVCRAADESRVRAASAPAVHGAQGSARPHGGRRRPGERWPLTQPRR